jgi:membrane associated rhomboid family serine protease
MPYTRAQYEGDPVIPPAILNLLIANGVVFAMQMFFPHAARDILLRYGALQPVGSGFYPWQPLTYGFLHSTFRMSHILFNMLALWMFGRELELRWGTKRFLTYYLIGVIGAGLTNLAYMHLSGEFSIVIGASGGTFAILLAFGMTFPDRQVMLLFPPIPMKARTLVICYGAMEFFLGMSGLQSQVAHFAHLGGLLTGWLLLRWWRMRGADV